MLILLSPHSIWVRWQKYQVVVLKSEDTKKVLTLLKIDSETKKAFRRRGALKEWLIIYKMQWVPKGKNTHKITKVMVIRDENTLFCFWLGPHRKSRMIGFYLNWLSSIYTDSPLLSPDKGESYLHTPGFVTFKQWLFRKNLSDTWLLFKLFTRCS